jgi:hypothetical protein
MMLPANTTFTLSSTLNITKQNVFVLGAGVSSTVVRRGSSLNSGDLISVWGTNFKISKVTLDGNAVPQLAEELGLWGADPVVDGIEVRNNASVGIAVATAGAKIVNSRIVGLASPTVGCMGIWFDSPRVERLVISDNVVTDQRLNGIFGSGRNIEISRNFLSGNHRQVFPTGGGQICIKGVTTNANISIVGNTVEAGGGVVTSGVEIDGPPVNIVWNTIRGQNLFGIILQSGFGHQVIGNVIGNSGTRVFPEPGIEVAAGVSGFRVAGNRVYDDQTVKTQSVGVQVESGPSRDYVIAGNDLRGNLFGGISDGGFGANRKVYGNLVGP